MTNFINLKVSTPGGVLYNQPILQLEVKTLSGYIGILRGHTPFIGGVIPSMIYIRNERNERESAVINRGIVDVSKDEIKIITDFFQFTKNLNVDVINLRKERIEQIIAKRKKENVSQIYNNIYLGIEKDTNLLKNLVKE